MREIAIFSDIHGNLEALRAIIQDLKKQKIKEIYCLGDVIGIGPNSRETLNLIRENDIKLLLGNHEIYFLNKFRKNEIFEAGSNHTEHHMWISSLLNDEDRGFLEKCVLFQKIEKNEIKIKLSHFFIKEDIHDGDYPFYEIDLRSKENIADKRVDSDVEYNFFGHIHKKFFFEKEGKKYHCIGSSGCVKENETFYNIIRIEKEKVCVEEKKVIFDRESFNKTMNFITYPEKEEIHKKFF